MTKKDPKEYLLAHSKAKIQLLNEYLSRYLSILSLAGYTPEIKIYDVFCGAGLYKDEGKGSPFVILEAIKKFLDSQTALGKEVPTYFSCMFNDVDELKIEGLKKNIEIQLPGIENIAELNYSSTDYSQAIKTISEEVAEFDKEKGFIFIDPYGYKIKIDDIKNLVATRKAEVLLFLPIQFMYRFANKATPQSLREFMSDLAEEENLPESNSEFEYIENLRTLFAKKIGKDFFVDSFFIKKDASTVFSLFFFCSHILAFEKMLESKWRIDNEQGIGWKYNTSGDSLFGELLRTNPLETKIIEFLKTGNKSNGEIYRFTLNCRFLPTHATQVLSKLQSTGQISVTAADGSKPRKGSFYINYKEFRDNHNRVSIASL